MNRLIRLAAVVIPAVGLAGLWATSHQTYQQGTEWEVPIQGYDPRDYLRGHYVEFNYDWPGVEEFRDAPPQMLCLEGAAPALARVTARVLADLLLQARGDIELAIDAHCTTERGAAFRARPADHAASLLLQFTS
ncbi:MAG: GDYXXLXY domain-containing protein, partial [Rhizobiales bacterium]|nr:GDYXXLXY domain-containing protein [Hyphomicrobiales bacterium]